MSELDNRRVDMDRYYRDLQNAQQSSSIDKIEAVFFSKYFFSLFNFFYL